MEKVKGSWSLVSVKIALAALVLQLISMFLPWYTEGRQSMSAMEAIQEKPSYFTGVLPMFIIGLLLVAVLFLLNHPKLTLIGDVLLLIVFAGFIVTGMNYGLSPGAGTFLYAAGLLVSIVCAFLTKKRKKSKPAAAN